MLDNYIDWSRCVVRGTVCLTCGDQGCLDILVTCAKCQDSAEHLYCSSEWPKNFEDDHIDWNWICHNCRLREAEQSNFCMGTESTEGKACSVASIKGTVCLMCGDKGYSDSLVTCVKCQDSAEHRYCSSEWPKNSEDDIDLNWICYDCRLWDKEQSIPMDLVFRPSNRNELMHLSNVAPMKGIVCLTCGDEGNSDSFVTCVKCHDSAEHRYCSSERPKNSEDDVDWNWICYDCLKQDAVQSFPTDPTSTPSNRNELMQLNSVAPVEGTVCLMCGDKGISDALLTCVECWDSAEHRYCSSERPKDFEDDIDQNWICYDCQLQDANQSIPMDPISSPSNKNALMLLPGLQSSDFCMDIQLPKENACSTVAPMEGTVCLTCGDKGISEALVTCVKCQDSAEHRYRPKNFENDIDWNWICYDCRLQDEEQSIPVDPISNPSNRNALVLLPSVQMSDFFLEIPMEIQMSESSHSQNACEVPFEADSAKYFQVATKKPHLLEKEHTTCSSMDLDEFQESGQEQGPSNISELIEMIEFLPAQPLSEPSWKGSFSISSDHSYTVMELAAHLSTKASIEVFEAAQQLPSLLPLKLYPRLKLWPKFFCRSVPTDRQIELYFLPETERDESVYDSLLDGIIVRDLALVAVVEDLELLVFTSLQLPQQFWRFMGKHYLWGVFREKKCCLQNQSAEP